MYSVVPASSCRVPGAKALVRWEGRIAFSGSLVEVKSDIQSHSCQMTMGRKEETKEQRARCHLT